MKKLILGTIVLGLVIGAAKSARGETVSGACNYERHEGVCFITEVGASSPTRFTFMGRVAGRPVQFEGNETNGQFKPNDEVYCHLQFITQGTCTPCGFDLRGSWGSCGERAWNFYRGGR